MTTRKSDSARRLPAEWEPYQAVLLAWPHPDTDWSYILPDVTATYISLVKTLVAEGLAVVIAAPDTALPKSCLADVAPGDNILYFDVPTNDTWARDFGVITCIEDGRPLLCDFKFNGWGLKFAADRDNLITRRMWEARLLDGRYDNRLGFVLEGGSIESDGCGTILTTSQCLLSPNRNGDLSRHDIEDYLCRSLGARRILWLDHGYLAGDDTDSHIDTLARLVAPDTIVYVKCDDPADEHYAALAEMERQLMQFTTADGKPYNLIALPMPDPVYDADGNRLPATYANFLITPRSVIMPVYAQPQKDLLAEQIMKIVYPDRRIHRIDCRPLIQQHGSLHCITMQLPHNVLPV